MDSADRAQRKAAKSAAAAGGEWDRCRQFLAAKKRYCNVRRVPGGDFCGNHLAPSDAAGANERMPCPVDPTHTLFVRDLAAHVRVCNAATRRREMETHPCFRAGANHGPAHPADEAAIAAFHEGFAGGGGGGGGGEGSGGRKRRLDPDDGDDGGDGDEGGKGGEGDARDAAGVASAANSVHRMLASGSVDLPAFAARVRRLYDTHVGPLPVEPSPATPAGEALVAAATGGGMSRHTLRHELQQAAIVGHMAAAGLLPRVAGAAGGAHAAAAGGHGGGGSDAGATPPPPLLLVEFGAGRGMLSASVAGYLAHHAASAPASAPRVEPRVAVAAQPYSYLLVDRGAVRRKADGRLGGGDPGEGEGAPPTPAAGPGAPTTTRLRMDIADLDLAAAPAAWPAGCACARSPGGVGAPPAAAACAEPATAPPCAAPAPGGVGVVGYGKHLCGAATDLALRCLALGVGAAGDVTDGAPHTPAPPRPPHAPALAGVAIATCCHHRCDWRHYVGRAWWTGVLGATPLEFELARMLSSWAVDGGGRAPAAEGGDGGVDRAAVGRACKRLIDAGRAAYLRAAFGLAAPAPGGDGGGGGGGVVRLLTYCEPGASPENCLLLAAARPPAGGGA